MITGRDARIDLFRGLALIFILWDHIPQNPLAHLTVRNYGFSDAAEIFVFLAGFAAALAYGKVALRDGYLLASVKIWRRAWVLYVVHIFLVVVVMGLVFFANSHIETRDMVQEMGLSYFVSNPQQALVDELLLRFKPNLMDPLPLYIALLAALPLVLPLMHRCLTYVVGGSVALYLMASFFQWNLNGIEGGLWYFNPFAWQVLFVLGGAMALHAQNPNRVPDTRPVLRQPLFVICALFVVACFAVALPWKWPYVPVEGELSAFVQWIQPINKTNLAPTRLLHFLALVYCVSKLVPRGVWLNRWIPRQLAAMGRHSLEVFCLGVVLAPAADMLNALAGDQLWAQVATAMAGVALMHMLAVWLDWNKQLDSRARPVQAVPSPT